MDEETRQVVPAIGKENDRADKQRNITSIKFIVLAIFEWSLAKI